jgi:hypothetical protein
VVEAASGAEEVLEFEEGVQVDTGEDRLGIQGVVAQVDMALVEDMAEDTALVVDTAEDTVLEEDIRLAEVDLLIRNITYGI